MALDSSMRVTLEQFIAREKLPDTYLQTVEQWFLPLAEQVMQRVAVHHQALLVGVSGCQGSGKTTLASLLVLLLREMLGLRCINLSIDDFYLTYAERQRLAHDVHPLLATRGVPGTHDVQLARDTIALLRGEGEVAIPRFSKAIDDRVPESEWPRVQAPVDVIVLEGWCLAVPKQHEDDLQHPINSLEELEDSEGVWRGHVNRQIEQQYAALYDMIDYLIMLKAPDFMKVFEWRQNQEDKLAAQQQAKVQGQAQEEVSRVMDREQLQRFIQHYERLTRHGLDTLPAKADVVFQLTGEQTIAGRLKG